MNRIVKLTAVVLLLLGSLAAQESKSTTPAATHPNQRLRWEIITQPLPKEGRTVVMLKKMELTDAFIGNCEPLLVAEFSFEGDKMKAPAHVALGFISNSFRDRRLTIIADGKRIVLGRLKLMRFEEGNSCRQMIHRVGVLVPRDTFRRIVDAKMIKVRVGREVVPFATEHRAALSELASRMHSSEARKFQE